MTALVPCCAAMRQAMVDLVAGAIDRGYAAGAASCALPGWRGTVHEAERLVAPVPTATREYPRVVRFLSQIGFQVVVTYGADGFHSHYGNVWQDYPAGDSVACLARAWGIAHDDTIAALLDLKRQPTEQVTTTPSGPCPGCGATTTESAP